MYACISTNHRNHHRMYVGELVSEWVIGSVIATKLANLQDTNRVGRREQAREQEQARQQE